MTRLQLPEAALAAIGFTPRLIRPVGGGCCAEAYRLEGPQGESVFAKTMVGSDPFAAEALGLERIRQAEGVYAPEPLYVGHGLLILEWIPFRSPVGGFSERLGAALARTHRYIEESYGFPLDHCIGTTPQQNLPRVPVAPGTWADFWWTRRLEAMLRRLPAELSRRYAPLEVPVRTLLGDRCPAASLLHGDLWRGNTGMDRGGRPVVFDPAAYFGDREADLGMTLMFGGFPDSFYAGYQSVWPLDPGWEARLPLYQLYHVLNHVLLFGNAYLAEAEQIRKAYAP